MNYSKYFPLTLVKVVAEAAKLQHVGAKFASILYISKKVIKAGTYKTVNSKPLTLAKNALKKSAPISKWRQFILAADNVDLLRLGGKEIRFAS